jgi:hypothetical protein
MFSWTVIKQNPSFTLLKVQVKMQENVNCGNGKECVMTLGKLKGPQKML